IRQIRRRLPIIFGGWHPSLLPAQTLREDFLDAVIRGQGELTLLEAAERLRSGLSFDSVRGISYKPHGEAVHNAQRPVESVERLPTPAFASADFDAYETVSGIRQLPYASSVGCPYACNYCTDQVFYNRRFNAYSAGRVVSEVTELVARHRLDEVAFLDSNLPVNVKRALAIAPGFFEFQTAIRLDFPGLHRSVVPDERCGSVFARGGWGFPHGLWHRIGLEGSPGFDEQKASAHRRDV